MMGFGRLTILPFVMVSLFASSVFAGQSNKNYEIQITKQNQIIFKNNCYKFFGNIVEKQKGGKDKIICSFPDDDGKDIAIDPNSNRSLSVSCGSQHAEYYLTKEETNAMVYKIILHFDFYNDHSEKDFGIQKTIVDTTDFILVY